MPKVNLIFVHVRSLSEKFVDTINIFKRKINATKIDFSASAKMFYRQIDDFFFMKI